MQSQGQTRGVGRCKEKPGERCIVRNGAASDEWLSVQPLASVAGHALAERREEGRFVTTGQTFLVCATFFLAMRFPVRLFLGWLVFVTIAAVAPHSHGDEPVLSRIALGSCARQNRPQPIWDAVVGCRPELFLMIGDNIYGDTEDMSVLREKYGQLGAQPGFQKLCATCPLLAVWDDHDYGVNDGGREYPRRAESQQVFNEFFKTPADSPRRSRPGIYDAHMFGPVGKRVQVILLDTRYFRSPLALRPPADRKQGPFMATDDPQATMLGDDQWQWLDTQLKQPAEVRIIASSIQVIADDHRWEKWGNMPRERRRLFDLIRQHRAGGVIFISGDRHLAEISRIDANSDESGVSYPLYDLTSSSLNQPSGGGNENEVNRFRLGENYLQVNFGTIAIDWSQNDPSVTLAVHDLAGEPICQETVKLSDLQP